MTPEHLELFSSAYLYREFGSELAEFTGSPEEAELLERLRHWSQRDMQNEVTAQGAFVDRFFKQLWGYTAAGEGERDRGYPDATTRGAYGPDRSKLVASKRIR